MKYILWLLIGMISLALIVFLQSGFIFVLFGLMPTIVAYFVDVLPGKHVFKCVFACNLAGMAPTFADVLQSDSLGATLQTLMADPLLWFIVYFSAGGGYILLWVCRTITHVTVTISADSKIESLKKQQEELIEEWGPLIKKHYA
jgi:hypothetical protein